jgi:cell division protein FtsW
MFYSLLAVYSSSAAVAFREHDGNTTYFLRSQFIMLAICVGLIVLIHRLPYTIYFRLAGLFLIGAAILLFLTPFLGVRINEASRFLEIPGTSFRIQTSDLAKVALVIYLARALSKSRSEMNNFVHVSLYFMFPVGVICLLIMSENLSTALMVFLISMIIMFIGRVPFRFLLAYVGFAVVGVVLFAMVLSVVTEYNRVEVWKTRIERYMSDTENQDADFQLNQAKIAISTGGLFGKAPGKSSQRNLLPHSNSDFIFAIIIEEYGLLFGAIPLILAYMILLFRGITIAKKCDTAFPAYLVMGLIIMISVQAMLNMLVAVGLFPVTGQTLPMVSWGRTSALIMSFSIGAILSVSRVLDARAETWTTAYDDVQTLHKTHLKKE